MWEREFPVFWLIPTNPAFNLPFLTTVAEIPRYITAFENLGYRRIRLYQMNIKRNNNALINFYICYNIE